MERRGGSSCCPAREAGRIARDRRGGHGAVNGDGAVNGHDAVNGLLSMAFPATKPPVGPPPMDRNGGHNLKVVWTKVYVRIICSSYF